MSDDTISFCVDFGGVELELSGDREFVETMYQRVLADIERARRRIDDRRAQIKMPELEDGKRPSVWLHRCGELMRKIYMASRHDLERSAIGELFEVEQLTDIYLEEPVFAEFFEHLEGDNTLWAEFTEVGRDKIASASKSGGTISEIDS